jgi:hypothetical protein
MINNGDKMFVKNTEWGLEMMIESDVYKLNRTPLTIIAPIIRY